MSDEKSVKPATQLSKDKVKKLEAWVDSQGDIRDTYQLYVNHLIKEDDPVVLKRDELAANKKSTFRYILEKTHPAGNRYAPLSYDKMRKAFAFESDPGAVPKKPSNDGGRGKAKKRKRMSDIDSMGSDSEDGSEGEAKNKESIALQRELLKAVDAMIKCKWSRPLKSHVEGFKLMGFPHGNPFAVVLERNGWIPDDYFEIIQEPIDLATIKNRVRDLFYSDVDAFERHVRLVISNAFKYNVDKKSVMNKMAKIQRKNVEDELSKLKKRLAKLR